ncbi:uncharacterized protein CELE_Y71F9AR.10 [Caenorhabditis elegans]|uniref:Secreted protein n=1 Tax=Caenorhabditis elegans TaxID=6239 RepID=A0A2K5ATL5_CAEEL|nr:Secreted protein [Caenorhabditis elegans]SPC47103.1 Secreted protein [Caenorhabditis elegans]|eukprot:NP_001348651.1 Uncharacterized protein CELE_Y71F9AR.10 [Caenorhabditis elegans]
MIPQLILSILLLLPFPTFQQENYQEISIFPPSTWHQHVHDPYHVYYNGNHHNGGRVIDHRNDQVRTSHGHFHTCEGWTCHSDFTNRK